MGVREVLEVQISGAVALSAGLVQDLIERKASEHVRRDRVARTHLGAGATRAAGQPVAPPVREEVGVILGPRDTRDLEQAAQIVTRHADLFLAPQGSREPHGEQLVVDQLANEGRRHVAQTSVQDALLRAFGDGLGELSRQLGLVHQCRDDRRLGPRLVTALALDERRATRRRHGTRNDLERGARPRPAVAVQDVRLGELRATHLDQRPLDEVLDLFDVGQRAIADPLVVRDGGVQRSEPPVAGRESQSDDLLDLARELGIDLPYRRLGTLDSARMRAGS